MSLGGLALTVLMAFGLIRDANAYIDPNAGGPLFQFLVPLFIAITSALVAFRRMVTQLWRRTASAILAAVRGGKSTDSYLGDRIDPP